MTLPYQTEFIDLCMRTGVLKFGTFTLKSGRESPYFFNAGLFSAGAAIAAVGRAYGDAIVASDITFDMLFGPAYKGIPLALAAAIGLEAGEEVEWELLDRSELHLVRPVGQAPTTARRAPKK